jgi:hypothetical protein
MLNALIKVAILFAAVAFAAKPACALYMHVPVPELNLGGTVSHGKVRVPGQLSMGPDPGGKAREAVTPGTTDKPAAQAPGDANPSAGSKPNQNNAPTGNAEPSNPQRDSGEKPAAGTAVTPPASPGTSKPSKQ